MAEPAIKFDTAAAAEQLVEAGVPHKQAAAHVRLLANFFNDNLATKADIERLELKLDSEIAGVRTEIAEVRTDIARVRTEIAEVRTDIAEVRTEVTEVRAEVANLEARIADKFDQLKTEFSDRAFDSLKWTAGMQIGTILAIVAAIKLL